MQSVVLAPSPLHEALSRVARAVVRCIGDHCEISLYDLDNVKSPLLYRAGALVSERDTGLPDQIGTALRQSGHTGEELLFFSRTATGRTLKNMVTFLADEAATTTPSPRYACCVTLDATSLLGQLDFLESMIGDARKVPASEPYCTPETIMQPAPVLIRSRTGDSVSLPKAEPCMRGTQTQGMPLAGESARPLPVCERRNLNGQEALSAHIADALRQVAVPVSLMTNHDRMRLVEYLETRGVFLLKGAVDQVAAALSVTRYTVYYYLKKMRA